MKNKLDNKSYFNNIAVIGLGYVGIPLILTINSNIKPINLFGIDYDKKKIRLLKKNINHLNGEKNLDLKNINFSTNYQPIAVSNTIIITVPTPLKNNLPDYSAVISVIKSLDKYDLQNKLIILESTVGIGDTQRLFKKFLLKNSFNQIRLVFSPEREDPGNKKFRLKSIPKIIGSNQNSTLDIASKFYSKICKKVVKANSIEEAESSKLLENTFRLINISFINEFKSILKDKNIDFWNVIKLASTKPFGFMPFFPSIGAGGHCIPIDPVYLISNVKKLNKHSIINNSIKYNNYLPLMLFNELSTKIQKKDKILFIGLSYKQGIPDLRESYAFFLFKIFYKQNYKKLYYNCIKDYKVKEAQFISQKSNKKFDVIIITQNISADILKRYINKNTKIFDFTTTTNSRFISHSKFML